MKRQKENNFYTSYSTLSEVKLVTIGLASPRLIQSWAEKLIPTGKDSNYKFVGEVLNANTVHHKTFKPHKGGLFCERIFGPVKDFECACGKPFKSKKIINKVKSPLSLAISDIMRKSSFNNPRVNLNKPPIKKDETGRKINYRRHYCNICGVEYTWSVIRRYQLGYIRLISPVTHVWYLKGSPSYLSILLNIKKRHLEHIVYCLNMYLHQQLYLTHGSGHHRTHLNFLQYQYYFHKKMHRQKLAYHFLRHLYHLHKN